MDNEITTRDANAMDDFQSSYTPQSTKKSKQLYNLALGIQTIEKTTTKTKKKTARNSSNNNHHHQIDIEDIELYNIYESNDGIDPLNTTLEQLAFTSPSTKTIKPKRLKKLLDKLKRKTTKKNDNSKQQFLAPVLEAIIGKQENHSPAKNRKQPNNINDNNSNDVNNNQKAFNSTEVLMHLRIVLTKSSFYKAGITIPLFGILCALSMEMFHPYHGYNIVILLVLTASTGFQFFPLKTARPQIVISLVTALTIAIDILSILWNAYSITYYYITLIVLVILCKMYALQHFLQNGKGTRKAREILLKKIRVFVPSYKRPYSMREIRLRVLAIGWIQLISIAIYALLLVFAVTSFQYSMMFASAVATVTLPLALMIKSIFSAVLFLIIFLDADIILTLSKFGCLGFATRYVKEYTEKKHQQLGGPPRVYNFNSKRFKFLTTIKVVDVVLGIILWVALAQASQANFRALKTDFKAFLGLNAAILCVTDIWAPLLFSAIYLMLRKKNDDDDSDSDVSVDYDASPKRTPKKKGNVEQSEVDDNGVESDDDDEDDNEEEDDDDDSEDGDDNDDDEGEEDYNDENGEYREYQNEYGEYENDYGEYADYAEHVDGDIENEVIEDESSPLHQKSSRAVSPKATSQFHSVRDNIRRGSSKNAFSGSVDTDNYSSPIMKNEKTSIKYPQENVSVRIQSINNDLFLILTDGKQRIHLGSSDSIMTKEPMRRNRSDYLALDHDCSIDPSTFTSLFSALSGAFSSEFNCKIVPKEDFSFDKLTKHLINNGFVVVSSSKVDGLFECQIFGSGYIDHENILFLANIKIIISSENKNSVMQCTSKSTRNRVNHYFIAKFSLGDLLTLTD